uniref:TNF receptor superfamily member 17 n=1 Tax=Pelusios castaneus TaxID=367368 RepID=A0A8C8R583_9SAUR
VILMAQHCFKNEYFDNLLQSCKPCRLRCSSKPPFPCQSYCDESQVSHGIVWISLGIGVILTFIMFILMVLFKRIKPKQSKEELKNTGTKNMIHSDIETNVSTDITGDSLQSEASLMYSVEECTCVDCGLVTLQTGFDTSFPLPATEEGATVLVTTKTSDYCSYIPGAVMTL